MRIQTLNVERFGHQTNLFLDGFSERLNVVYGPNGSGKSTAIQFIRWMFFGNFDEVTSRYVAAAKFNRTWDSVAPSPSPRTYPTVSHALSHSSAGGSISFAEDGRRRTLARQDDGSRYGRVALDGDERYARQSHHLVSLLGNVTPADFDLLYAPDFARDNGLYALLQSSMARGVDLTSHSLPSERVQELRLRIDDYRRELDQLPWHSGDARGLLDRKRSLEHRLGSMSDDQRRRRSEFELEAEEIGRQIRDLEIAVERTRESWHARDEEVAARRSELEQAWRNAEEAKETYLRRRRNELEELDTHINRARSMQSELQRRYDGLESKLRETDLSLDRNPKDVEEATCLVQSIALQLDEMRSADVTETLPNRHQSTYRYRGSKAPTGASLEMLRREVGQLCETLQQERTGDRVRAMADELDQLRQTDATMQTWISGLNTQRELIARELDDAARHGVSLVVDDEYRTQHDLASIDPIRDLEVYEPLRTGRLRAVPHSCDGFEPIAPESDALLRQLTRARDAAQNDLQSVERNLTQRMERRRDIETALTRLSDRDLESARRELAEVDSLIRSAEERERLQYEIAQTEEEIARLREVVRNSPVTEHAARILQRLTHNAYAGLRIDSMRSVSVLDPRGMLIPVGQLSRGVHDQVYLAFCLAIVTAYRRQGVQLPFILNDAFINIDSNYDDTLVVVLREFADMGQQVLVFTRHDHVVRLLQNEGAHYLQLGRPAVPAQPVVDRQETIDQVRFRPRTESPTQIYPTHRTSEPRRDFTGHRSMSSTYRSHPQVEPTPAGREFHQADDYEFPPRGPSHRPPHHDLENVTFTNEPPTHEVAYSHLPPAPVTSTVVPPAYAPRAPLPPAPRSPAAATATRVQPNIPTVLSLEATVDSVGTVDAVLASRLRAIGIVTIDDFLRMSPAAIEEHVRSWGLEPRPIQRWQSQVALRCRIPELAADDARLVVACGINNISQLAATSVDELSQRMGHLISTYRDRNGERYSMRGYSAHRIANWITAAQSIYRRMQEQGSPRDTSNSTLHNEISPPYPNGNDPYDHTGDYERTTGQSDREDRPSRGSTASGRSARSASSQGRSGLANGGRSPRSRRRNRSSSPLSGRDSGSANVENRELRFYLDPDDAVVDAPTIGPKTAKRLHKVGIRKVKDLLVADPEHLATELDDDRLDAGIIRQWQQQSILACRIPQLRGHDAQILVACGVTNPESLAGLSPRDLWARVKPFVGTAECKRIVRGGKDPDEAEIRDWITWAEHSRDLQSA